MLKQILSISHTKLAVLAIFSLMITACGAPTAPATDEAATPAPTATAEAISDAEATDVEAGAEAEATEE